MKKLSLVQKIGGGFCLVLVLMFIVSALSWNGLSKLSTGQDTFKQSVDDTNRNFQMQTNMLMLQMQVKDYIISGDPKVIEGYRGFLAQVDKAILAARKDLSNSAQIEILNDISTKVEEFKAAFERIISLKNQRTKLYDEKMAVLGPSIAQNLGSIMDVAHNDQDEVASYLAGMALRSLLLGRIYVFNYLDTSNPGFIENAENEFSQLDQFAKKMSVLLFDESSKASASKSRSDAIEFISTFKELVSIIEERDTIAAEVLENLGPEIVSSVSTLSMAVIEDQKKLGQELQSQARSTQTLVLFIAAFALATGVLLAFLLTRAITKPILKTADFAGVMAKGDFSGTLDIDQEDEIGKMAKSLNDMTRELAIMFKDIIGGIRTLSNSSGELKTIAAEMAAGSADTSQKSNTVATAAEEMSINMTSVAAAMEEASSNTSLVASATDELTSTVNKISEGAGRAREISNNAVDQSSQTYKKMEVLGEAATRIGRVTETITEISEQTNLLALNATIEAARAGEAGKGFAVVANEIKELAKQTAGATVDIKNQIESMQQTTSSTVSDIKKISEIISEINDVINTIGTAVEEQASVTAEITENITQSSLGISEVNENVAQSTIVVSDISREISEVNISAGKMTRSSSKVEVSAEGLSALAHQLEKMVAKFRV